jgi:hypothetical protein
MQSRCRWSPRCRRGVRSGDCGKGRSWRSTVTYWNWLLGVVTVFEKDGKNVTAARLKDGHSTFFLHLLQFGTRARSSPGLHDACTTGSPSPTGDQWGQSEFPPCIFFFFSFLGFVVGRGGTKNAFQLSGSRVMRSPERSRNLVLDRFPSHPRVPWPLPVATGQCFSPCLPAWHQDENQDSMETATPPWMQAVIIAMPWSEQLESADSQARSLDSKSLSKSCRLALALAQLCCWGTKIPWRPRRLHGCRL